MTLSIVIPTLSRYEYLIKTIDSLGKQSFQDFEIIVIDQTDSHAGSISFDDKRVFVINEKQQSASKARNVGIKAAKGDIVLFLDDDIIIDYPHFLSNHVRHYFENSSCPGVSGGILAMDKIFRTSRHKWSFKKRVGWLFFPFNYNKQANIENGWSANLSVRKSWAVEVGGMDEQYVKGAFREEADFCTRLVKKFGHIIFDPEAYVIHIGAMTGGLRSFKSHSLLKAQHHFDGMFYYLFRNVSITDYPYHMIAFCLIFFKRSAILKNPLLVIVFIKRTITGIVNALYKIIHGRKLLIESE